MSKTPLAEGSAAGLENAQSHSSHHGHGGISAQDLQNRAAESLKLLRSTTIIPKSMVQSSRLLSAPLSRGVLPQHSMKVLGERISRFSLSSEEELLTDDDDVDGGPWEMGSADEEEEGEEDEEEEDEEEEETEESEQESEEQLVLRRDKLIEQYLLFKQDHLYLRKKNAFLQNKLYELCVRKGFIVETLQAQKQGDERSGKKKGYAHHGRQSKRLTIQKHIVADEAEVDLDEVVGVSKSVLGDEDLLEGPREKPSYLELTEGLSALENNRQRKYTAAVQHVLQLENLRTNIAGGQEDRLRELTEKRAESEQNCFLFFQDFMSRIRKCTRESINTNTSSQRDTEQYVEEMEKLFQKLRQTIQKFYMTWHGLNYDIQKLEESELQGAGLQPIEYEQLCGENATLRDKVDYHELEMENVKSTIAHAVQKLSHIRETEFHVDQHIETKKVEIGKIKTKIETLIEDLDQVTTDYSGLRDEQRLLVQNSALLDNTTLLKDYEETSTKVSALHVERKRLISESRHENLQIQSLRQRIRSVTQEVGPEKILEQREQGKRAKMKAKKEAETKRREVMERNRASDELKMLRLLELLEQRGNEPWKRTREQLVRENYCVPRVTLSC